MRKLFFLPSVTHLLFVDDKMDVHGYLLKHGCLCNCVRKRTYILCPQKNLCPQKVYYSLIIISVAMNVLQLRFFTLMTAQCLSKKCS